MRFCCHSGKSVGWKNNKHCHLHKNMTLYMFDWCRCVVQNSTLQSHCIKNGQKKWLRKVMMLSERRTKQDRKRKKLRKWERKGESETNENWNLSAQASWRGAHLDKTRLNEIKLETLGQKLRCQFKTFVCFETYSLAKKHSQGRLYW